MGGFAVKAKVADWEREEEEEEEVDNKDESCYS